MTRLMLSLMLTYTVQALDCDVTACHGKTLADCDLPKNQPECTSLSINDVKAPGTGIHGPIPENIGDLTRLDYISFYSTKITGKIPTSIGKLTDLTQFSVQSGAALTGQVPWTEVAKLKKLTHFVIDNSELTGQVPDLHLPKLIWFDARGNQFTGKLPFIQGDAKNLNGLTLGGSNKFTGVLPDGYCGDGSNKLGYYTGDVYFCGLPAAITWPENSAVCANVTHFCELKNPPPTPPTTTTKPPPPATTIALSKASGLFFLNGIAMILALVGLVA